MSRRICFVSFEISPFTAGGIGTWLRNTLDTYSDRSDRLEVLYLGTSTIDPQAFQERFPRVELHVVNMDDPGDGTLPPDGPSRSSGIDTVAQWQSYVVAMALKKLERETGTFDIIEFIDWSGPAFYSIQEKKFGSAFADTLLAVRLHSTEGALRQHETRSWGFENLVIKDLERLALRDADIIVGHLQTIIDANRDLYGFDETWVAKTHVNVPPIVNKIESKETVALSDAAAPLLFTSKIQSFKRPDLFIRGCVEFALKSESQKTEIVFMAHEVDVTLRKRIQDAVPKQLKQKVRFLDLNDQHKREQIIARGIAVFPGVYESFCYAAYEAGRAGGIIVLNRENPAFGDNTPWLEGVNCLKFDGTAHDLARVLSELFERSGRGESHGLSPVDIQHAETPYWESVALTPGSTKVAAQDEATKDERGVSVIITHRDQGPELLQTVSDLLAEQAVPLDIIVVDDNSETAESAHILEQLEEVAENSDALAPIVRRRARGGYAVALNTALVEARHEYVCILSSGDRIEAGFLKRAATFLDKNEEYAAVVPAARMVENAGNMKAVTHFMPLGEPLGTGLFANRACSSVAVCRRELLARYRFDEALTAKWNWDLVTRLIVDGYRVLTTADIGADILTSNDYKQAWSSEAERREAFDVVHRRFAASGPGWRLPLTVLGDGEMTSMAWYHSAQFSAGDGSLPQEGMFGEMEELTQLKNATSVRIALAIAHGIKKSTPRLYGPVRRFLRKRLDG